MKLLYQVHVGRGTLAEACASFEEFKESPERVRTFALELAQGVVDRRSDVDDVLRGALTGWDLDRLAAIDGQLLRVAVYELLFCDDIPARVTIDEAIEISREYSTGESTKFVNGVLDAVASKHAARKLEKGT
jgi:N utilization substance protein B